MTEGADCPEQTPPAVVTFPDEIDIISEPAAAAKLTAAISTGAPVIIADLTHTTFVDSSGARMLYQAHHQADAIGAQLRLATSQPAVLRVLELLGYDQVLAIYRSARQAITAGAPVR
jgi:anti-anti-sigma factor